MSGNWISLAAEALVAVLLVITIGYCILLNARLKRLRADESDLRATISELVTATEIAERAIGGLKAAAVDCDKTLANRMREAEHFSVEIAREIVEGQKVLTRIKQIASAVRKADVAPAGPAAIAATKPSEATAGSQRDAGGVATVALGKADVRNLQYRSEAALTASQEGAGTSAMAEPMIDVRADTQRAPLDTKTRSANRIEELRAMAEQARERLKELRKVNTEKAA